MTHRGLARGFALPMEPRFPKLPFEPMHLSLVPSPLVAVAHRGSARLPGPVLRVLLLAALLTSAGCAAAPLGRDDATTRTDGEQSDPLMDDAGGDAHVGDADSVPDATGDVIDGVALPLRTCDRFIVDAEGTRFKLASVNWYGASDDYNVVGGLAEQPLDHIVQLVIDMGFNSVRLPFSNEMLRAMAVDPAHVASNPTLVGLSPLEVFDAVVNALTARGIVVLLNNHTTFSEWCCNHYDRNALWMGEGLSEAQWIEDWVSLAKRYRDNAYVAGFDLRNEIRDPGGDQRLDDGTKLQRAVWQSGEGQFNWRRAAQTAGEAILAVNPDALVIVEGLDFSTDFYEMKWHDLGLASKQRTVLSPHNYAFHDDAYGQMSYAQMEKRLNQDWGFLLRDEMIRRASDGRCLDVDAETMEQPGAAVTLWSCHRAVQQQWRRDEGTGAIRNASGVCLSAAAEGSPVTSEPCDATLTAQQFRVDAGLIHPTAGNGALCLGTANESDGATLMVQRCDGSSRQRFELHVGEGTPVWLGEFGQSADGATGHPWFANVVAYLREYDVDWAYWPLNAGDKPAQPGAYEIYTMLKADWSSPLENDVRLEALQSIMAPSSGPGIDRPRCN